MLLGIGGASGAVAHPWGGLVIDDSGTIYFTFICPIVDEDHHACVWQINDQQELVSVLRSSASPSDIVLTRSYNRTLFGAERSSVGAGWQARLWQFDQPVWKTIIAPTTDPGQFHIQAYAVNDAGTLFFAREDQLYQRNSEGTVTAVAVQGTFDRIDAMAWGPGERLYIIDQGSIRVLAPDGTLSTLASGLKQEAPEDLPFSGANILFDLAVDDGGNVFVAYYGNRRVLKVSAAGSVRTYLRASVPWSPHGVDVYEGELYVLESTVGGGTWWKFWERPVIIPRVRKVRLDGTVETVFLYRSID